MTNEEGGIGLATHEIRVDKGSRIFYHVGDSRFHLDYFRGSSKHDYKATKDKRNKRNNP